MRFDIPSVQFLFLLNFSSLLWIVRCYWITMENSAQMHMQEMDIAKGTKTVGPNIEAQLQPQLDLAPLRNVNPDNFTEEYGLSGKLADPSTEPKADPKADPNADPNAEYGLSGKLADPSTEPKAEPKTDPNAENKKFKRHLKQSRKKAIDGARKGMRTGGPDIQAQPQLALAPLPNLNPDYCTGEVSAVAMKEANKRLKSPRKQALKKQYADTRKAME